MNNKASQPSKKSIAFHTFGCKLNFSETSLLKNELPDEKYEIRSFKAKSDIYVLHTCSVTQDVSRDCRKAIRSAHRRNPDARIVVIGCYAQLEPEEITNIEGVDLVLGNDEKYDLLKYLDFSDGQKAPAIKQKSSKELNSFHHAFSANDRTRAFLKIQDGCDYTCSFCTVPMARGKSRSGTIEQLLDNARSIIENGYKEIVLTGVNIADFGKNNNESFLDLLIAFDSLSGLERLRISSMEPNLITEPLIAFLAQSRTVQPHFHIPLQSGSEALLRYMKRRYTPALYREKTDQILSKIPDAAIGVDVITGHPGEDDTLFQETLSFLQSLPVAYLHVFTYSERPDTAAGTMPASVPLRIRKERTRLLRELSEKKRYLFSFRFIGHQKPVLFEKTEKGDKIFGWTDNYIRVMASGLSGFDNSIVNCKLGPYLSDKSVLLAQPLLTEAKP